MQNDRAISLPGPDPRRRGAVSRGCLVGLGLGGAFLLLLLIVGGAGVSKYNQLKSRRVIVEKEGDWALRTFERRPVDGKCEECGAETLAEYRVLSEGGWWDVRKCQTCLASLSRVLIREFPVNLTAMVFGYKTKANFTVENERAIQTAPKVDFSKPGEKK